MGCRLYILALALLVVACASPNLSTEELQTKDDKQTSSNRATNNTPSPSTEGSSGGAPDPPPPAPPPAGTKCVDGDGATYCGTPEQTDTGNLYACNGGTYTKYATCSYGCQANGNRGIATCKPKPAAPPPTPQFQECCAIVKAKPKDNDNFCFGGVNNAKCPMTQPGGYCDPNGDGSFTDGDWTRGYNDFHTYCK